MTPTIKACVTLLPRCAVQADGSILLVLPMPPRALSPNACRGQSIWAAMAKAKLVKRHREIARLIMASALASLDKRPCFAGYSMQFFFRTAAFRDDDNADASCKAYRDGIAQALGVDDRTLRKLLLSTYQKDGAAPRVEITLHP